MYHLAEYQPFLLTSIRKRVVLRIDCASIPNPRFLVDHHAHTAEFHSFTCYALHHAARAGAHMCLRLRHQPTVNTTKPAINLSESRNLYRFPVILDFGMVSKGFSLVCSLVYSPLIVSYITTTRRKRQTEKLWITAAVLHLTRVMEGKSAKKTLSSPFLKFFYNVVIR